jgi:clan AA aspartic protease
MGEVRVRVRLTNAGDEILVRRGLMTPEQVRTFEVDALVDSGAVRTVLPQAIASRLGLDPMGEERAVYADGRREVVPMMGPVRVHIAGRNTAEEALVLGDDVLIGQTILEKLDLLVDCDGRRVVPNPAHPDGAVTRV